MYQSLWCRTLSLKNKKEFLAHKKKKLQKGKRQVRVKIKVSKCIIVKENVTGKITMHVLHLASGFVLKYIPDWQAKYQLKADIASACSNLWLKGFPQISP